VPLVTTNMTDFTKRLEDKVREQLAGQRVGYLLGAGSSYLDGQGYPLASEWWDVIRDGLPRQERSEIQTKLDQEATGLEQALDLLDTGGMEAPLRETVTEAIAEQFRPLTPPLNHHVEFVKRVCVRSDRVRTIFSLNYDPLMERAADEAQVRLIDGFTGFEHAYFDPQLYEQEALIMPSDLWGRLSGAPARRERIPIHLLKLHGSLGWYEDTSLGAIRCGFGMPVPAGTKRLMVPPQHRKATDTTAPPYAALWSRFRGLLTQGPQLLNRLVCLGYGLQDEHVNSVIENALAGHHFTLLVFAKDLADAVFDRWASKPNVIIVTADRCSLYSDCGPGHSDLWRFEKLCTEV